jgi:hypothetical protein
MHRLWGFLTGERHPHRLVVLQMLVVLVSGFLIASANATVVIRFQNRSLFVQNTEPGVTTDYTVSLTYTTETSIGSLDMLFCIDPIPIDPCDPPAGLDVSGAVLADQTGETGYTIDPGTHTSNHILLTRTPGVVGQTPSTYKFTGIVNPTFMSHSFSIRMADYASTNGTGTIIDLGSVTTQVTDSIIIETQVPPILVFCVAAQVSPDCTNNNGVNYTDMGTLGPDDTLAASSQMAVGTNASAGYSIQVFGTPMQAGVSVITPLAAPTPSILGIRQFGINLVANTDPLVGQDPDGAFTNAVVAPDYATPNQFKFQDGDLVASAPNVSLVRRFTVSYIVNSPLDLRPGVYTTTLTYVCTGHF